ncbi:UBP-type zinc finger domain-containing protein [Rhizobium cauense]|uniref:UBP-type zinc finger domain-containing protein n=1 Tax=Rhizobium cauense TaxID=1166683 RepID=UPI0009DE936C|nr:UBP-type zinc finger domain-containing protein [Rhizobium cauense]MBW9114606.1 UBP-type zinc finger domain-containing protein [Rhizobium cauense]
MVISCDHVRLARSVKPLTAGCEECLAEGEIWFHLRLCRECGHVGCCDQSAGKHATKHFEETGHPIIEGYDPPEGWGWCFLDQDFVELPNQTPQEGKIPRYY